jgi:hypothetical protein
LIFCNKQSVGPSDPLEIDNAFCTAFYASGYYKVVLLGSGGAFGGPLIGGIIRALAKRHQSEKEKNLQR